jgi:4'-phosphopantetheinyl transferase
VDALLDLSWLALGKQSKLRGMNTQAQTGNLVQLWFAPVAASYDAARLAAYETLLKGDELARWRRFHYAVDRQRFLVGRAFMRTVLAECLGHPDPASLQFSYTAHGKPELAGPHAGKLHFNLSHTDALLVLAVDRRHAVGVDVEAVTRNVELLALAKRYFAAHEYAELAELDESAQRERFFALWTLKEAWLKARGLGLHIPLDDFSFNLDGANPVVEFGPQLNDRADAWQFRLLTQDQFRVALAVDCPANQPLAVQTREWR